MKAQHRGRRTYQDDIYDLQQEVLRLREELQEERRMRVFAVAALNQRLQRLERAVRVQYSDDEEEVQVKRKKEKKTANKSPKQASVPSPKTAFKKESASSCCPQPAAKPPARPAANPSVPADAPSKPVKVVTAQSNVSKGAMLKHIDPVPPSKEETEENRSEVKSPAEASVNSLSFEAVVPPAMSPETQVRSPTSILAPSTPGSPGKDHKVQFVDTPKAGTSLFKVGEKVLVRCVEGANEPRWDRATVSKLQRGDKYGVKFSDGEEWAEVPVSELRKMSDSSAVNMFDLLVNESVYFSGFVWLHEIGWLQTTARKQWLMVLESKLYFASDPSETDYERELPLKGKTIDTSNFEGSNVPAGRTFSVKGGEVSYNFVCESEYDRNLWVAKLRLGAVKTDPTGCTLTAGQKDACIEASKANARPVVPSNDPKVKAEDAHACLIKGYVVSRSANAWFTKGDWARRWVTLHAGWLAIRPNKETPTGTIIVPLKDTILSSVKTDPENPYSIEVGGPFTKPPVALCFDSSPIYMRWCLLLEQAYLKANPEKLSSGLDMQEITEGDIEEEKRPELDLEGDGGQL